ncbi:MAG: hypothetical protein IPP96_02030 [Chitinophagaceae bacterium]|nr:hypothetical protein [Chitinophagaceae bacterium]
MIAKAFSILALVLSAFASKGVAADTLVVIFDRQNLVHGDSVEIEIYTEPYRSDRVAQTLHLWIDNVKTGQRWKYRYPFIKGRYKIALKINDSIPNGTYAFNFLLQNRFLAVKGKLVNAKEEDEEINYVATTKNKAPIIDGVKLGSDGSFKIDNLFYTDSVYFGFSPVQKSKENRLKISIETPLDSVFVPEAVTTELVTVGTAEIQNIQTDAATYGYVFSITDKKDKQLLREVVVKTKQKGQRERYENENVSGLFASDNAKTIDFHDNDELRNYSDIYSYLTANIAGLVTVNDEATGRTLLYWRNEKVNIFVDEFADPEFSPYSISVQDIELVKIYSPGSRLGLDGFGGSVAIYTRRFSNHPGNRLSNYSFYVKGYTQKSTEWK